MKKHAKNNVKKYLFVFLLVFSIVFPVVSNANSQDDKKTSLDSSSFNSNLKNNINSTNNIVTNSLIVAQKNKLLEEEISKSKKAKSDRFEKLKNDKIKFIKMGSLNIKNDNMFYPTAKSNLTAEEIEIGLKGTELEGTGKAFKQAEEKYGINSIFLIAMANHESYYGSSNIAKRKNNLFGFNANDSNPMGDASSFSSYSDCILKVSYKLKKLYLSDDGIYFGGYHSFGINKKYSSDPQWPEKVNNQMLEYTQKLINNWK